VSVVQWLEIPSVMITKHPENTQHSVDLNQNNPIDANDWIALGFSPNFNKRSIPSMKTIAEKVSGLKGMISLHCS
jgi:hypothetical protein